MEKARDQTASDFTTYATAIRSLLHMQAYRLCRDWYEADDLVQATLYKVYCRWQWLAEHDNLGAYTHRALVNAYISERRRHRWKWEVSYAQPPERHIADHRVDVSVDLARALRRLSTHQRAIVVLRFYNDLSVQQTATILGCTVGTITSQTYRALNRLRVLLEPP